MCYNLVFMTKKKLDYARWHGATEEELSGLEQELRDLEKRLDNRPPTFHANAYGLYDIPVITDKKPNDIQFIEWGMIADEPWNKDLGKFAIPHNRKFNARGEKMFETPSFKKAAMKSRCLVLVDGFFDNYTVEYTGPRGGKKKKSYPFYIRLKSEKPFCMAGLWAVKNFEKEGIAKTTVTIVTCAPNEMMAKIHNKPAASEEPRMPLILPPELYDDWLAHKGADTIEKQRILEMVKPYPEDEMVAHSVHRLSGKESVSNTEEKLEEFIYDDLEYPV